MVPQIQVCSLSIASAQHELTNQLSTSFLLSAALDGGTSVMIFVWTFAVGGGGNKIVEFPVWALVSLEFNLFPNGILTLSSESWCRQKARLLHALNVDLVVYILLRLLLLFETV